MRATRPPVPARVPTRRAGRTAVAALAAAALVLAIPTSASAVGESTALNANDLAPGEYLGEVFDTGTDFAIAAVEKDVDVDGHDRVSDRGVEFAQRIKLNGGGAETNRSLHFTVTDEQVPTQVFVNARSGSGSSDRALGLYDSSGQLATVPALADDGGQAIETASFDIATAGDYWLASPSSGVNVYYAQIGPFDPQTRAPWGEVAAPAIDAVAVDPADPGDVLVSYTGLLGDDGGDVVYATLFDSTGAVVDQTLDATDGPGGTLTLSPPASGDYEVEVRLTRAGETVPLASARADLAGFSLPLAGPEITASLTTAVAAGSATVTLEWSAVAEAESYSVETSQGGAAFTEAVGGVTETTTAVSGLTPGDTYQMRVVAHRGADATAGAAADVDVAAQVERWLIADVGSNAGSGSGGVTDHGDGTITFDAKDSSTKIASSNPNLRR